MARPLGPDEQAVWSRVAATVRPLTGRRIRPPAAGPALAVQPTEPVAPKTSRAVMATPVAAATLDAGWDRRTRQGRLAPDRSIDLHGMTVAHAHAALAEAVERASTDGARILHVVTGKGGSGEGRGVLRASLASWLDTPRLRPYVAALRTAHPRHGGAGAWYIILRRRREVHSRA